MKVTLTVVVVTELFVNVGLSLAVFLAVVVTVAVAVALGVAVGVDVAVVKTTAYYQFRDAAGNFYAIRFLFGCSYELDLIVII